MRRNQKVLVRRAVATLPSRQRALLGLLVSSPSMSCEETSAGLDIPVGSLGPTRARILARPRTTLEMPASTTPCRPDSGVLIG